MKLGGRLTGHFLARVALLLGALGAIFLAWIIIVAMATVNANKPATLGTSQVVRRLAAETSVTASGQVVIAPALVREARRSHVWVQVLDENGTEVASYDRPAKVPTHYSPGKLVLYHDQPGADGFGQLSVSTWVDTIGGRELTFVAGLPGGPPRGPTILLNNKTNSPSFKTVLALISALLVAGALVTLGVAWLSGRSLAKPLVHMMNWLSALARGDYAEPLDKRGAPASRNNDGSLRRPYSTYREVFGSLGTLTAELQATTEERARIEEARDEWLASVSHDLRTPLTSVEGYAQLLASDHDFDPAEVRRQASRIATQAGYMDELIDDMNLSFRLRSDALVLDREALDLVELVRESAVALANDPRSAGRSVAFDDPAGTGAVSVSADPKLLRRALGNLLVNAAIHNPEGTTVRASVAREGAWVVVRIADDGVGMDEATRARLFDRYFRGTSAGPSAEGTGLGMAITREIAVAHGGTIEVESAPGAGTTVRLALPVASAPGSASGTAPTPASS